MRNRNVQLNIRLTEEEMERLRANAEKARYTVSNYLRALISGNSPKEHPDLEYFAFAEEAEYVLDSLGGMCANLDRVFKSADGSIDMSEYIDALNEEVFTMHRLLWDIREAMQLPGKAAQPDNLNEMFAQ